MYKTLYIIVFISLAFSCNSDKTIKTDNDKNQSELVKDDITDTTVQVNNEINSDYDMSTVDIKDRTEFKENLAKIEKEHGEQWSFCKCVVKNDSINKAFEVEVSDEEFDRLSARFDEIDTRCKAFLAQNPNQTPEDRMKHEKKVRKCLNENGL